MVELLVALREEHRNLRTLLETCTAASGAELRSTLGRLREGLAQHVPRKDQLYRDIELAAKERNDPGSASIARIFENNMRVQTAGVFGFFDQLEALAKQPDQLLKRSKTVIDVIRTRLDTEERAVFPIYEKLIQAKERHR